MPRGTPVTRLNALANIMIVILLVAGSFVGMVALLPEAEGLSGSSVVVTYTPATREVQPTKTAIFTVEVKSYDQSGWIQFDVQNAAPGGPEDWEVLINGLRTYEMSVPTGNAQNPVSAYATITAQAENDAEAGDVFVVNINWQTSNTQGDYSTPIASGGVAPTVTVASKFQPQIGPGTSDPLVSKAMDSPGQVTFKVDVTNAGNDYDTFEFSVDPATLPPDFSVQVPANQAMDPMNAASGGDVVQDLDIVINTDVVVEAKSYSNIKIIVKSQGNLSKMAYHYLSVTVNPVYDISYDMLNSPITPLPGSATVTLKYRINNTGNTRDQKVNLNIDEMTNAGNPDYGDWVPGGGDWSAVVESPVTLSGFKGTKVINVVVTIPVGTGAQQRQVTLNAISNPGGATESKTAVVDIKEIHNAGFSMFGGSANVQHVDPATGVPAPSFDIDVFNNGNEIDDYELRIKQSSQDILDMYDWTAVLDTHSIPNLDFQGAPVTVTLDVTVPANTNAPTGKVPIVIEALYRETGQDPVVVGNFTVYVYVDEFYDPILICLNPSTTQRPDSANYKPVTFNLEVHNQGNAVDDFDIDSVLTSNPVAATPENLALWRSSFVSIVQNVPAEGQTGLDVTYEIPPEAVPGTYEWTVTAESDNDPGNTDTMLLTINVEQRYEIRLTTTQSSKTTTPNTQVSFTLDVKNLGSDNDNIALFPATSSPYQNWVVITPASFNLAADAVQTVTVDITPEAGTLVDPLGKDVEIVAQSLDDPASSPFQISKIFNVKIDEGYGVTAYADEEDRTAGPGAEVTYRITVKNSGNLNDSYRAYHANIPADWGKEWINDKWQTKTITPIEMPEPDDLDILELKVSVPQTATIGAPAEQFTVEVESIGSLTGVTISTIIQLSLEVVDERSVELYVENGRQSVSAGSMAEFGLDITNTGTLDDSYTLSIVAGKEPWMTVSWTPTDRQVDAVAGEKNRTASVQITISDSAQFEPLPESATIRVQVKSDNTGSVYEIIDLVLDIVPKVDIELTAESRELKTKPGNNVTFEITVRNKGSEEDSFHLEKNVDLEYSNWMDEVLKDYTLDEGNETTFKVDVLVPASEAPKRVKFQINASSERDDQKMVTLNLYVEVEQVFDLEVKSVSGDQEGNPNEAVVFKFEIKNDGTAQDTVKVEVDGGDLSLATHQLDKTTINISANGKETVTLTVTVKEFTKSNYKENLQYNIKATSKIDSAKEPETSSASSILELGFETDFQVNIPEPREEVTPDYDLKTEVTFDIDITNKAPGPDNYVLTATYSTGAVNGQTWNKVTETTADVAADGKLTVSLTINVPAKASADGGEITYDLEIKSEDRPGDAVTQTLTIEVKNFFALEISGSDVDTGDTVEDDERVVTIPVEVENRGNSEDEIELTATTTDEDWDLKWVNSKITLAAGEVRAVDLSVTVPLSALVDTYEVRITATSMNTETDETISDTASVNVKVTEVHDFEKPGLDTTISGNRRIQEFEYTGSGGTVTWTYNFENTGNDVVTFKVEYEGSLEKWALEIEDFEVAKQTVVAKEIRVTVPDENKEALAGTYYLNITVTIDEDNDRTEVIRVELEIEQYDSFDAETPSDEEMSPGDIQYLYIDITNEGNVVDTYRAKADGDNSDWVTAGSPLTLSPGDEGSIELVVEIPSIGGTRSGDVPTADTYDIPITIESSKGADDLEVDLTIVIEEDYTMTANRIGNNILAIGTDEMDDGEYEIEFELVNDGNVEDSSIELSYSLTPSGSDWSVSFNPASPVRVDVDEPKTVTVTIKAPDDLEGEVSKTLVIKAIPTGDSNAKKELSYSLNFQAPKLEASLSYETTPTVGQTSTITCTVTNKGLVDSGEVTVTVKYGSATVKKKTFDSIAGNSGAESFNFEFEPEEVDDELKVSISTDMADFDDTLSVGATKAPLLGGNIMIYGVLAAIIVILLIVIAVMVRSGKSTEVPEDVKKELEELRRKAAAQSKAAPPVKGPRTFEQKSLPKPGETPLLLKGKSGKSAGGKPSKPVRIKCPKCDTVQTIKSTERPLEIDCIDCGMKLVLKK